MAKQWRCAVVDRADTFVLEAEAILASPPARLSPEAVARRAARRFTMAAHTYREANLGLMTRRCHERAAELWDSIGEKNLTRASRGWARATPVYWDADA